MYKRQGKTRSSILISCGARLAPFDIREVRELMEGDEMELDTIGDEKTVLFLIMSDTDTTFNFILAMLQSQLINLLCDRADDKYGGRLPVHVEISLPVCQCVPKYPPHRLPVSHPPHEDAL